MKQNLLFVAVALVGCATAPSPPKAPAAPEKQPPTVVAKPASRSCSFFPDCTFEEDRGAFTAGSPATEDEHAAFTAWSSDLAAHSPDLIAKATVKECGTLRNGVWVDRDERACLVEISGPTAKVFENAQSASRSFSISLEQYWSWNGEPQIGPCADDQEPIGPGHFMRRMPYFLLRVGRLETAAKGPLRAYVIILTDPRTVRSRDGCFRDGP